MQTHRSRFSLKVLIAAVTLPALVLGAWIGYAKYQKNNLVNLRQQGAIVIIRHKTPGMLQSVGIEKFEPLTSVPTVELYVTPKGTNALIGDSEELISVSTAQERILAQVIAARNNGAKDIQLILLDDFDAGWARFAWSHSMNVIGDTRARYLERLKANRASGANINPQ